MSKKSILTVAKNPQTGLLEIHEDVFIKSIAAVSYEVDEDYDFGSIDPRDLALELYLDPSLSYPGIKVYSE